MRKNLPFILLALFGFSIPQICIASNPKVNGVNTSSGRIILKEGEYHPGVVIIKMKPNVRVACTPSSISVGSVNEKLVLIGSNGVAKMFPHVSVPVTERNRFGKEMVDLSLIYRVSFTSSMKIEDVINILRSDETIAYAEPEYVNHLCFTPDDPSLGLQYALTNINAYNAWNINQGDTNVVIGIVDTGTDPDHPDLAANLKHNYADPINGIDDDGDGYVDNYSGWDIAVGDNDATTVSSTHGSHVSGCADAVTNNATGVASPAFKCKFMPIKCILDDANGTFHNEYDGITYAADHGCSVINLSWGRTGGPSAMEQDVMNYAAINHDVVVCVAAGNNSVNQDFYPSNYDNVICVSATTSTDAKASYSNYGPHTWLCAPGDNIYSTVYNNSYTYMSGTSMASPCAAGCAALVRSRFPSFNAAQTAQQLRNTCDNIYSVSGNSAYANFLGKGRINLYNALLDTISPGVRMNLVSITDGNDDIWVGGDTLKITILFKNLLHPTSAAASAILSAQSTQVTVLSNTFAVGALNTFDTISNYSVGIYKVLIKPTAPINTTVPFKVTITDGTYNDFLTFTEVVNVDYINVEVNDLLTTASSTGRIGYAGVAVTGLGVQYMGSSTLLYESSLMVGDGTHETADAVRNGTVGSTDNDFADQSRILQSPSALADFYATGMTNENGSTATNKLGILIHHNCYAWATNPDRGYVIFEYVIKNINTTAAGDLSNLYAGIFADYDVINVAGTTDYASNKDSVDLTRRMGIAHNTSPDGYWVGTKLLTHAGFNHYGIDNDGIGHGGVNLSGGFTDALKYTTLSTNRNTAGDSTVTGNDVCDVTSTGPFSLAHGDSVKVAFAIVGGLDLATLLSNADAAQIKYNAISIGITENPTPVYIPLTIYPNPANKSSSFNFTVNENSRVELSVYNTLGDKVKELLNRSLSKGSYTYYQDLSDLESGTYYVRLISNLKSETRQMIIVR